MVQYKMEKDKLWINLFSTLYGSLLVYLRFRSAKLQYSHVRKHFGPFDLTCIHIPTMDLVQFERISDSNGMSCVFFLIRSFVTDSHFEMSQKFSFDNDDRFNQLTGNIVLLTIHFCCC